MPTSTTNYELIKPGTDDPILIEQLNTNADIIDNALKENADALGGKVDKETGKGLSTNDFTTVEKTKLDDLAEIKSIGTGLNLDDNGELTATGGGSGGTTNYNDLSNKPQINGNTLSGNKTSAQLGLASASDIPTVPITAIQKNGTGITPVSGTVNITVPTQASDINAATATQGDKADTAIQGIKVNNSTVNPDSNKVISITVPTTAADVSALPDTTKYAAALSLTINSSTYVITGQLKDQNGDNLGTAQTIDLPLESVVVGGSYNSQTKKVVLTLQNGNTIEFSVADLVSGLQTELSASNKLNPAYINYDSTHRAVSDTEKSTWNGKQSALTTAQLAAVNSGIDRAKVEQIETNKNNISLNTQYSGGRNIGNFAYYGLNPDQSIVAGTITHTENNGVFTFTGAADSSKNYACYLLKKQLIKAGSYVVSGISGGSTSTYWLRIGTGISDTFKMNVTDSGTALILDSDTKITVQLVVKAGVSLDKKVFSPMIITATDWANSHDFQQYGESNAHLSSIIQVDTDNMTEFKFAKLDELNNSVHSKYGFLIGGGGQSTPNKVMFWHIFVNTVGTVYFTKIFGDDTITLTGSISDGVLTITSSATIYGGLRLIWLG